MFRLGIGAGLGTALSFCAIVAGTVQADVQPADGSELSRTQVRLDWSEFSHSGFHDVQVGLVTGPGDPFQDLILDERASSNVLIVKDGLIFGESYRWRVREVTDGIPGDWLFDSGFSVRPIPSDFALQVTTVVGQADPQPGVTVFNHCDSIVGYDLDGQLVLLVDTPARVSDAKVIGDGRLLFVGGGQAWILSLDGTVLWSSPDDDDFRIHHCASMMPSGNVLMLVRDYREIEQDGVTRTWQGDRVVEMNPETNEIVWDWSTFDYYTTDDYDVHQSNHWNDWTHLNDAHYVEADNSIYISCRHLSRVTRIDYDTGQIVYNMGMDFASGDVDFGDDLFSYQHSPQLLANGNMVLFDNGNRRGGAPAGADGFSRAIEVEFTGTPPTAAKVNWSWQTPVYCPSTGDANRLANGHTLVTATQLSGVYEVTLAGEEAWRLDIVGTETCAGLRPGYRATRVADLYLDGGTLCVGDIDGDGAVAVDDLLILLGQWGGTGSGDLNDDDVVDVSDVLILLKRWGDCDR
ncbi:MAG: aryl-sulfate sulfotransferase [Phycisphaerales bacterium]|nr:aryl-sulfate sulfotransferase [Phycisphaerales bacterium]